MRENHYAISCIFLKSPTFSVYKMSITLLIFLKCRTNQGLAIANLSKFCENLAISDRKILSFATHTAFRVRWFQHLVGLHHAAVGEAAVIFILFAAPRVVWWDASASTWLGELGCAIEIAEKQLHRTFQNLVEMLDDWRQKLYVKNRPSFQHISELLA